MHFSRRLNWKHAISDYSYLVQVQTYIKTMMYNISYLMKSLLLQNTHDYWGQERDLQTTWHQPINACSQTSFNNSYWPINAVVAENHTNYATGLPHVLHPLTRVHPRFFSWSTIPVWQWKASNHLAWEHRLSSHCWCGWYLQNRYLLWICSKSQPTDDVYHTERRWF